MKNKIIRVFKNSYEDEFDILGKSTIGNLVDTAVLQKDLTLFESEEGRNLEFGEYISFAFGAIQVIIGIIQIVESRKARRVAIEKQDVYEEIMSKKESISKLELKNLDYDTIIEEVLSQDES